MKFFINEVIVYHFYLLLFLLLSYASVSISADPVEGSKIASEEDDAEDNKIRATTGISAQEINASPRLDLPNAQNPCSMKADASSPLPAKYFVVSIGWVGFANCTRFLNSALQLAKHSDRQLVVDWQITVHMPGRFDEFFEEPLLTMFEKSDLGKFGYSLDRIKSAEDGDPMIKNIGLKNSRYAMNNVLPNLGMYPQPIIYFTSSLPFIPAGMSETDWKKNTIEFYKSLRPNEWIKEQVHLFRDKYSAYYMIGVHYRGWQTGEADVNSSLTTDPHNKYVSEFIKAMKEEVNRSLSETDNKLVAFFLAADNKDVKDTIMKEPLFHGRIFTRGDQIERNTVRGQESAIVDFFLLGFTEFILGTRESSFSDEGKYLTTQRKKVEIGPNPYN